MNMNFKSLLSSILLTSTVLLGACDPEDGGAEADAGPPQEFTCTARLSPVELNYVIDAADKNKLNVTVDGKTTTWNRVSYVDLENKPLLGGWRVESTKIDEETSVRLDAIIEEDEKTKAQTVTAYAQCLFADFATSARVTSPAVLTATTIKILEAKEDVQKVTR